MQPPQIMPMFAVPFGFGRLPDATRLNSDLRRYILEREQLGDAGRNPNPLTARNKPVYESHFDFFRDPHPAVQELKRFCWDQLLTTIGQLNGYSLEQLHTLQIYNHAWFHVTRRGGYFALHNHPNASWSGVYCVDPGRHDDGHRDSGALCFMNPMTPSAMYLDPGNSQIPPPYGLQLRTLRFEAGQLVLFPSWVMHDVRVFEGEGERITIAFNCWFTFPESTRASL
jgi:Putative 2OG-Fe(II) oxygenase